MGIRVHGGGKGGEVPPRSRPLSPTAIFNIPDQGCNSEKNFLPALFPPLQNFFAPCPIPLPENLISPWPFPPSPEIIWPIPYPHHPPLPYPHPLSQKSKFISPSYIFYFPAHIPLLNFLCSSPCISPSIEF